MPHGEMIQAGSPKILSLNVALYYAGWIACVIGASSGRWVTGTAIAGCLVLVHHAMATERDVELRLAVAVAGIGTLIDSVQTALGLLVFHVGQPIDWLAPVWVIVLWPLFATTLRYALYWLNTRPLTGAALGVFGGPLAFYAGHRLGAVDFHPTTGLSLGVLAIVWGILIPCLLRLSRQITKNGLPGSYRFNHLGALRKTRPINQ